ncbi:MAG: phosphatase PAP2 family protein [Euryarchaeota archaeon]|nr:phosphatase PAP2 family protein [Euryarchaeota archaeon]MBU4139723.1 phosphatase PAP2 family protein [Euryarchaeota archaeon]
MILEYLESVDSAVFLNINHNLTNPLFDAVFPSLRELTYVIWLIVIVYFWSKNEKKLALLLAVSIAAGAIFTYPLKFLIDRARPYETIESARLLTSAEYDPSFPSAHAEMSFLAATVVSRFHPEYAKYLYSFSFIVVLSRVYVGVHFPGDVVAGVIIGMMIGRGMLMVAKRKKNIFWDNMV